MNLTGRICSRKKCLVHPSDYALRYQVCWRRAAGRSVDLLVPDLHWIGGQEGGFRVSDMRDY